MAMLRLALQFTKSKSIFPTYDAIRKVVYMSVSEISKKWTMPVRDRGLVYAQFIIFLRTDSQLRETVRGSGLLVNPSVTSCVRRSRRIDTSPPLGETTRTPEFIRWKIPVKYGKQRTTPLLFTVYLVAASGCSPALPCFAALLVLLRFSGLFAFTQFFFQTRRMRSVSQKHIGANIILSHPLLF